MVSSASRYSVKGKTFFLKRPKKLKQFLTLKWRRRDRDNDFSFSQRLCVKPISSVEPHRYRRWVEAADKDADSEVS